MKIVSPVFAIAYRDILKFLRDPGRLIATFIFPFLFVGILGGSLQSNINAGYNFITFTFTGVLAQTLFQSSSLGIISLLEDRQSDFTQEIFVSPVSRYTIVFGKIFGETLVAMLQGVGIIIFGVIIRVPLNFAVIVALIPVSLVICLFGGAFGLLVLSSMQSKRAADQIFPFIMLPQFFLAGVFNPIKHQTFILDFLSRITPMRYAVDLLRNVYYSGKPEYSQVVLADPAVNFSIIALGFVILSVLGTMKFVSSERNK